MHVMAVPMRETTMPPRKKLTKRDFERITRHLNMSEPVLDRALAVLVDGQRQTDVAAQSGVGIGTVSAAVNKVWRAYLESFTMPADCEEVTALLTSDQAAVVRAWHRENTERRKPQ